MHPIPADFFRELAEDAVHPMAAVGISNKFVWVNSAFEGLVGYAAAELEQKTWMDITFQDDVGGDLASVKLVLEGKVQSYRMEKDYVHKRGFRVPVELIVRRFPRQTLEPLMLFRVEAGPVKATRPELQAVQREFEEVVSALRKRIDKYDTERNERVNVNVGDKWRDGDKSGRDKTTNSDTTIKIIAGAFGVMVLIIAWLFYYVATTANRTTPTPPPTINGMP